MPIKSKVDSSFSRKLTIQMGVCKRMSKEASYYVKEVAENTARVQKMRDDDKDPFDIKKQEEVLEESVMMVPDSRRRLGEVMRALQGLLAEGAEGQGQGGLDEGSEAVQEARAMVASFLQEEEDARSELAGGNKA